MPPHLAEAHRKAIQAWQYFKDRENDLLSQVEAIRGAKLEWLVALGLIGAVDLQRHLYPWVPRERHHQTAPKPLEQHAAFRNIDWSRRSLHVVMVQEGDSGGREFGTETVGDMTVHISARGKPVVLLLGSMAPVRWKVTWAPGAAPEKIVASSNKQPEVELQLTGPELVVLPPPGIRSVNSSLPDSWNSYLGLAQNLKTIAGADIATIQGSGAIFRALVNDKPLEFRPGPATPQSERYRIVVDGERNMAPNPPPPRREAVRFDGIMVLTLDGKVIPARDDGLTVPDEEGRGGEVAYPRAERVSGKWYWEAIHHKRRVGTGFFSDIGITDMTYDERRRRIAVHGITANYRHLLAGEEVIRFALDLDNRVLHVAINDSWIIGAPRGAKDGVALRPLVAYRPAVAPGKMSLPPHESDRFTFNFGAHPFRHAVPEGYSAYDARFSSSDLLSKRDRSWQQSRFDTSTLDESYRRRFASLSVSWPREIRIALDQAAAAWFGYRDAACEVWGQYRAGPAREAAGADIECIADFMASLDQHVSYYVPGLIPDQKPVGRTK